MKFLTRNSAANPRQTASRQKHNSVLMLILLLLFAFMLSGCGIFSSSVKSPQNSSYKAGGKTQRGTKPYTIRGKTYYPLKNAHDYREDGVASWYGPDFHGKQTANGERYDMHGMTAAHKILPFNTQLRVTHLGNGKQITVRVNDRGPFVSDRIIDLTKSGATQLGMIGTGTARVRIETIGGVKGMQDNGDITGSFYVQVGAFKVKDNANKLAARLRQRGLGSRSGYAELISMWRVQVGPYPSLFQAQQARERLRQEFPGGFVVSD